MSRYGTEDSDEFNGYHSRSRQATRKHKIIFSLIAIAIVVVIIVAFVKTT